jgi:hypothetical protein
MYYVFDKTTRSIHGGCSRRDLDTFMKNWTNVDSVESEVQIPVKFQGRWIVNEQGQVENIID